MSHQPPGASCRIPRPEDTANIGRRRTTAVRVLAGAAFGLLAGCQSDAPTLTGPPPSGRVAAMDSQPSLALSSTPGACVMAERASDGRYFGRSAVVPLPAGIAFSGGRITLFAYRGWAAGSPDPVQLAVCTIPDGPAARAYFKTRFSGKSMKLGELNSFAKSAGVARVQEWGPATSPGVMQGAQNVYMTDGLVSGSPATSAAPRVELKIPSGANFDVGLACDPNAIIPDPTCTPLPETVPTTPPAPAADPSTSLLPLLPAPTATPAPTPTVWCTVGTDYPHISTTAGFRGNLNVKSWNDCTAPMFQAVQSTLKRESCFLWVFCSWPTIGLPGFYTNPSAMQASTNSSASCDWQVGWYRGEGLHTTIYLGETHITRTATDGVWIACW